MDDSCAVCADNLEWVAYGACGHKEVCSTCVARLRFICDDRRCCICKTETTVVFVTKALGDYTQTVSNFSTFPHEPEEGRVGSYWYHEDTQALFDDPDHYKMIRAMCRLSCSVCDNMEQPTEGSRRRAKFRNIEQLKGHLFHQHRLLMCSLCLEGRKVFICEQKLYTRTQLYQHVNTGDSEVDGTESERGGFMGHPMCEFCRTPFYGDNELYLHMSTEHYTCHICQRQHPGQYEYYKNYDDLEIHFRGNHFLCEDESCLVKKFVVFMSEAELKRHNALEHGGRMSRSKRNAALQLPTSFSYRRSNEQDGLRGRGRIFRRDASETANLEGRSQDASSSSRRVVSDHAETSDIDPLISPFESLTTSGAEVSSRYSQAVLRNSQLEESSFPPLSIASGSQQQPQAESAANLEGRSQDASSSSRRVVSDHAETSDIDPLVSPFESLTTSGAEVSSRYSQAVLRNSLLEESSFPPLSIASGSQQQPQAESAVKNTMAARLRRQSNKNVNALGLGCVSGGASHTAPTANNGHRAWPVVSSVSESVSSSGQSKPAREIGSSPMTNHQQAWPAVSSSFGSTSTCVPSMPSIPSGSTSSCRNSILAQSAVVGESSSVGSLSSSRNWASTTRVKHTTSAPSFVESGSFDSSSCNFPPVPAKIHKLPASAQGVGDIHTANKSLVERTRLALNFDQDKYTTFKEKSGEYRQGLIDAETYLAYVEQFGLLHLVCELAILCPDVQKQNELIEIYNANFGHTCLQQNGSQVKDSSVSKKGKGKGKCIGVGDNTPKNMLADSIVKNLQSSYKPSEDEVEVLLKDGYRAFKGKSKVTTTLERELMPHSEALKVKDQNDLLAGGGSSRNKQKKKTPKFLRARLGDGSLSNLQNSNSGPESDGESKSTTHVHGVWRNGGGQKLLAKK